MSTNTQSQLPENDEAQGGACADDRAVVVTGSEKTTRLNISLTEEQIVKANLIGNGDLSQGVRLMIDAMCYHTTGLMTDAGIVNAFSGQPLGGTTH